MRGLERSALSSRIAAWGGAAAVSMLSWSIAFCALPSSTRVPSSKNHSTSEIAPGGRAIGESAPWSGCRRASSGSFALWASTSSLPYRSATSFIVEGGVAKRAAIFGWSIPPWSAIHAGTRAASSFSGIAWNACHAPQSGWTPARDR